MPRLRLLHPGLVSVTLLAAAAIAIAAPTPPKNEPSTSATPAASGEKPASENFAIAELAYKKGYKEAQEAKKLKKEGKTAKATEKFAKALERFECSEHL